MSMHPPLAHDAAKKTPHGQYQPSGSTCEKQLSVVVTGASGHLGFHIARECRRRGWKTSGLVRSINPNVIELEAAGANVVRCDLWKPATCSAAMQDADGLFHAAAENTTSLKNREEILRSIVGLTEVVLNTALESRIAKVFYTSSVVAPGRSADPNRLIDETTSVLSPDLPEGFESPYVEGKVQADAVCERFTKNHKLDVRCTYPSWLVGPSDLRGSPPQRTISDFVTKVKSVWIEGGVSIASVIEVARAHAAALEHGAINGRHILAGDNVSFRQFFEELAKASGRNVPRLKAPKPAMMLASRLATTLFRLLGREFPITPGYVKAIVGKYRRYSSDKAERELGYQVIPAAALLTDAVLDARRRYLGVIELGKVRVSPTPSNSDGPPLLLTGVPGWLGNRMVDVLINGDRSGRFASNRRVRLLVEPRFRELLQLPPQFEIVYGDICDAEKVRRAVAGTRTVFYLAWAIYPPLIEILYRVNFEGTRNLVDACAAAGVRRVLYMGTDSICGRGTPEQRLFNEQTPASPYRHYGRSKFMGEDYLLQQSREGKVDGTSLRGFWFFGPFAPERQRRFVRMFLWPRQLVFGNGRNLRSISHVDDTIAAFFQPENNPTTFSKWYWIGDAKPYTVDEIYAAIASAVGRPYRPVHIPVPLCGGFNLMDRLMGSVGRLHATIHAAGKFYFDIAGEVTAARRDFGFEPRMHLAESAQELAGELAGNHTTF